MVATHDNMAECKDIEQSGNDTIHYNINDILLHIGKFGLFQKLLIIVLFISCLPSSYQILIFYFLTITPSWVCITNITFCTGNGTNHANDFSRCNLPRTEWKYVETKHYSLVTDLKLYFSK